MNKRSDFGVHEFFKWLILCCLFATSVSAKSQENGVVYSLKTTDAWNLIAKSLTQEKSDILITNLPANDFQARFDPVYQRLYFDSYRTNQSRNIFQKDWLTGDIVQLTNLQTRDGHPDISSDGRYLAFQSGRSGDFEVYVLELNSNKLEQITKSNGFDGIPIWLHDNNNLAYNSSRHGSPDIFIVDRATKKHQRLTHLESNEFVLDWNNKTQQLLIRSNHQGKFRLYWLDPLSKSMQEVPLPKALEVLSAQLDVRGERLVFIAKSGNEQQVFLYHLIKKTINQLTFDTSQKRFPAFISMPKKKEKEAVQ